MSQLPLFQPASYSVADLTAYIRGLLEMDEILRDVWVQGEISNLSRPTSGHLYFTLKDNAAALKCVVWRSTAQRFKLNLQNGMAIEAHGAIGVFERDGIYQLYVDAVRLSGEGMLYMEFMRLKARLEAEGLFDEERKRPIPLRPRCIGIVTSPTGAALQDMLNTLRGRYPLAEVILAPCAVQGDSAPPEIVQALQRLWSIARPDIIIMARGGGSLEDLWAFNDERVVRAIASSPIPVITGVGHETDFTLADFASDLRAPTPTGAAVLATPNRSDLLEELNSLTEQMVDAFSTHLDSRRQDVSYARSRLEYASPVKRIRSDRQQIDYLTARAARQMDHRIELEAAHLTGIHNRLQALNPASVLLRGFALVERPDGSLVSRAGQAQAGDPLRVRMADGSLDVQVETIRLSSSPEDVEP